MKVNKSIRKTKEASEPPCMCEVHVRLDKELGRKSLCLGHGEGCPCYGTTGTDQAPQQSAESIALQV